MRRNKVDDVIKKITSYSAAEILTLNSVKLQYTNNSHGLWVYIYVNLMSIMWKQPTTTFQFWEDLKKLLVDIMHKEYILVSCNILFLSTVFEFFYNQLVEMIGSRALCRVTFTSTKSVFIV